MPLLFLLLVTLLGITSGFITGIAPLGGGIGFGPKNLHHRETTTTRSTTTICKARPTKRVTDELTNKSWFPKELIALQQFEEYNGTTTTTTTNDDSIIDSIQEEIQSNSLRLVTELILRRLHETSWKSSSSSSNNVDDSDIDEEDVDEEPIVRTAENNVAYEIAKGKFMDFCFTKTGEEELEYLFQDIDIVSNAKSTTTTIQGAIMILQSLLVLGSQVGLTITPGNFQNSVAHLRGNDYPTNATDFINWDKSYTRRLKYDNDRIPGLQLLASLGRKRTPRGAFDLLVRLGIWQPHEDLALIRSGFSLRFSSQDIEAANAASDNDRDPDTLLGIRRDFRHHKLYTIDSASTSEIDDALSVETIDGDEGEDGGEKRYRYWIHIADADRWAPRDSDLFQVAKERGTSLYLPQGSISMLPSRISSEVMSLRAGVDACALSLGVELNKDGSVNESTLIMTPSLVRVTYRLTYDEADEMIEEGLAFNEEWELGALFSAALLRRDYRIRNGSAEGFVAQIPQYSMSTYSDPKAPDGVQISLNVQVSHNGGRNQSSIAETPGSQSSNIIPVSSASTLVTEMMILAGEAIGKWKLNVENDQDADKTGRPKNIVRLPFRSQPKPDFKSRLREHSILLDLQEHNLGDGYCHAWYNRRFLTPVQITEDLMPHHGLGLGCYVQWSSPIRRFGDLQVHGAVKRFLRRQKLFELLDAGSTIPAGITSSDVGFDISQLLDKSTSLSDIRFDEDIDFKDGGRLLGVARSVQRVSQKYWMLEYLRRKKDSNPDLTFEALVLGCTNPSRRQYAIYIYELGFECMYINPVGYMQAGDRFEVMLVNVLPRNRQVTFTRTFTRKVDKS